MLTDALRTMINNSFKVFQKNNSFKKSFIIKEKNNVLIVFFFHISCVKIFLK